MSMTSDKRLSLKRDINGKPKEKLNPMTFIKLHIDRVLQFTE